MAEVVSDIVVARLGTDRADRRVDRLATKTDLNELKVDVTKWMMGALLAAVRTGQKLDDVVIRAVHAVVGLVRCQR